jgi:hypothetical protein
MRTKAEAHAERIEHGGLRYTFMDRDHYIGNAEMEASERTGISNHDEYQHDDTVPDFGPTMSLLLVEVHYRPGKVPIGDRPSHPEPAPVPFVPLAFKTPGPIHWLRSRGSRHSYTACGLDATHTNIRYGKRMFETMLKNGRVCGGCVEEFNRLVNAV